MFFFILYFLHSFLLPLSANTFYWAGFHRRGGGGHGLVLQGWESIAPGKRRRLVSRLANFAVNKPRVKLIIVMIGYTSGGIIYIKYVSILFVSLHALLVFV